MSALRVRPIVANRAFREGRHFGNVSSLYSANYTVLLTSGGTPNKAYGVLALADSFEDMIGPNLPRLTHAVLLPFQGRIIYDGLLSGHNITFGGGVKRMGTSITARTPT